MILTFILEQFRVIKKKSLHKQTQYNTRTRTLLAANFPVIIAGNLSATDTV